MTLDRQQLIGLEHFNSICEINVTVNQSTIQMQFNGQDLSVPTGCSIADLLEIVQMRSKLVAVELNLAIVPRELHQATLLSAGDIVEAVTLVGGG